MSSGSTAYRCTFRVDPELLDALSGMLFEGGVEGLEENLVGDELTTYVAREEDVERLRALYEEFRANARVVFPDAEMADLEVTRSDDGWQKIWREALEPAALAGGLVLRPTNRADAPSGERTLWFEPNESFGSGSHPTTRMLVAWLVEIGEAEPGLSLFDVGSGTGVLTLAALASGFSRALAVDVSPDAVTASRKSAELNGFSERVEVGLGSADSTSETFPVVVANIDARTLRILADALWARVAPRGRLLLAGLLDEDADEVRAPYERLGARVSRVERENGWTALLLVRG